MPDPATTGRRSDCPDTVNGWHNEPDRRGFCSWCGGRVTGPAPRPVRFDPPAPLLALAYRRAYDPDWGGGEGDSDPAW